MNTCLKKQATHPCYLRPCFLEFIVTEQSTTCCCFYRQICHGDGCHPGHLPGASHPCREDGRPLRARRAPQADVEAGGGGPAAAAGLNAQPAGGNAASCAGRTTCSCHACPAGCAVLKWYLTNGKKKMSRNWTAHSFRVTRETKIYSVKCDAWITEVFFPVWRRL